MRVDPLPACIVIDASLGLKWVFEEADSEQANALGQGRELVTSALFWPEAANDLAHPIYDCCYLAVAMAEDAVVVTADRRFRAAAMRLPSLAGRVLLLRDISLA